SRRSELEVAVVPDQGHAPLLAEPKLIRRIAAFVASCDAGTIASADSPTSLFFLRSAELIQRFLMGDPNLSQDARASSMECFAASSYSRTASSRVWSREARLIRKRCYCCGPYSRACRPGIAGRRKALH